MANVLWALSQQPQIDAKRGVITFDMEVADRLTLGEYVQNYSVNYISRELVQWAGVLAPQQTHPAWRRQDNLFVFRGTHEPVIKSGISVVRCAWMEPGCTALCKLSSTAS